MRNRSKLPMRRPSRWISGALILGVVGLLAGCGPAVQVDQNQTDEQAAVPDNGGWSQIATATEQGDQATMFRIQTDVTVKSGSMQSHFDLYGSINLPDRALVGITVSSNNVQFYQQGLSAYQLDHGTWTPTTAIPDLNVFPSYMGLVQYAMQHNLPLKRLPRAYVSDEYCTVFRAVIPQGGFQALPLWVTNPTEGDLGDSVVTFYVGEQDHMLREITTDSVGSVAGAGSFETTSDVHLSDYDNIVAKIQLPRPLVTQLEGK